MSAVAALSRSLFDLNPNKATELFSVNYELAICCNENNVLISQHWLNGGKTVGFHLAGQNVSQQFRTRMQYILVEKNLINWFVKFQTDANSGCVREST